MLKYTPMPDRMPLHFICAFAAGFTATCFGSPFDVVKTRVMQDKSGLYKGVMDCVVKTMKIEGPLAFYNGFTANFMRIGTFNIACFIVLEQVKYVMWPNLKKGT